MDANAQPVIASLEWLGLAVADVETANTFYEPLLGSPHEGADGELWYEVGPTDLRLKPPGTDPPGGAHVHYAFSAGERAYTEYKTTMAQHGPVEEHELGVYRSAYTFDPDDHCVEFAARDGDGTGLSSIFEIVLEVDSLEAAERWYNCFDPDLMDRGEERRRVRLDMGPFELELWEPQRGIADARPGAHVDIGLTVEERGTVLDRLDADSRRIDHTEVGTRIVDPDGHDLTIVG